MLPFEIGRSTAERAAFHEAAHAVYVWACGGQVKAIQVGYDDGRREWHGFTYADPLPNHSEQAEMLLAGGFSESLYLVNVYDASSWTINEAVTRPAFIAGLGGHPLPQHLSITFTGPNNAARVAQVHLDTFSNDWDRAVDLVNQHHLNINDVVHDSILRVNDPVFWRQVAEVARCFLLRPPRQLNWQYGCDDELENKRWQLGPIEKAVKKELGID